ncbi:PDDEXK nuclease domain-containing protein [uncultured Duncaniella sp.]|uniref:PDDEXK nuclease domain-containing protein n=1 Tax=uncultured Duncaniella sp. TaxID=2768039 RepID=UPI0025A9C3A0|nr:PDDEXK nuclease domain-containing protein [uncultured Duncaniella sp.]
MANNDKKPAFVKRDAIVSGKEYARLLGELKDRFRRSQIKAAVRVNSAMLEYYWEMGRDISRLYANAKYGSAFFDCLSLDLKAEFPGQTGFSATNIKYTKRWYEFYNQDNENRQRVVDDFKTDHSPNRQRLVDDSEMPTDFGLVPWGHHIDIFTRSKSVPEALFYIEQTIRNNWSRPELSAEIDDNLYSKQGRVVTSFDEKLPAPYSGLAKAILKSPYDFSFIDKKIVSERQLEDELASNITRFLLELGSGFAYVGRQMELKMPGGQVFVPDMIFYHTRLKAYIVCELKVVPYIPDFAGKLNFYVSAVDELMRQDDDNPTIGLLICKSKDDTVVEWSLRGMNQPLGVAEYKLISEKVAKLLPSESELWRIIDTYSSEFDKND